VLQPYDLPVNTGGKICKTLQSETSGISDVFKTSGAECDADAAGWHIPAHDDPDLQKLIRLWSALPVETRSGIMLIASSCKSSSAHQ
jgi:hypothetical protein